MNPLLISTAASIAADRMKPTTGRTKEDLMYEQLKDERKARRWKFIAYTAAGIAVAYAGYKGYRLIVDAINDKKEANDGGIKDAEKSVNKKMLTKDIAWYKSAASQLFAIMDEYYYFTEPIDKVIDVLNQLQNSDDWMELYAKFDIREETLNKYNFLTPFRGNLTQWFQHEFNEDNLKRIRETLAKINVTL